MEPIPMKQPTKGLPWILDVGGTPKQAGLAWEDVLEALEGLTDGPDSFVILEQKDGDAHWFIQCAENLSGPEQGAYMIECGWSSQDGPVLVSANGTLEQASALFRDAWEGREVCFDSFEDQSGTLPENLLKHLKITCLEVGEIGTNCYILANTAQKLGAIIDPGGDAKRILAEVNAQGLEVKYILLTHGHYDHADGLPELAEALPEAEIWVHQKDAEAGPAQLFPLAGMLADPNCPVKKFHYLKAFNDRDVPTPEARQLPFGDLVIHPMHTPGHSEGSVSFRISGGPIFSGDTLFRGSCGRTDFPGGNVRKMMASLRFFAQMNGDAEVYPGHMGATTLGLERKYNPYVREALRGAP